MSRVRVKICGVTRLEDALLACELGADALGFNLWPRSKRHLPAAEVRRIVDALPPFVAAVGVFVNQPRGEVERLAAEAGLGLVQLHGGEPPDEVARYRLPVIKAVQVEGPESLLRLAAYTSVRAHLVDAPGAGFGGLGRTCDWSVAATAARRFRLLLAGGLTPDNVGEAVRAVRPWGVDVASGVERSAGVKDAERLSRFFAAVRGAEREGAGDPPRDLGGARADPGSGRRRT